MSELKWPSEEEVRKMFAKKEGFGSDATLSAAMELPEVKALKEALRALLQAICGPTGFAEAVRLNSGLAYPWPALENAELQSRSAIAAIKEPKL